MPRSRSGAALLLGAALALLAGPARAQSGMRDRYFTRYPFDTWKNEGAVAEVKWSPRVLPARLSPHQRLLIRVEFVLDAKEAEKRRGRGEFILFLELTDAAGRRWRTHETFDLTRIPPEAKARQIVYAQDAFVTPGEYQVALALCDSHTLEHSFTRQTLRVQALRSDPLPDAWRDLPAVEYVREFAAPDIWFQPYLRGRLNLPLRTRRAVHLDVVMNMTPSERAAGSLNLFRRNMSVLIPALKVLCGIAPENGSLDVTVLDLTKRQMWEQANARGLDWSRMRVPFANSNPGVIDVQSLASKAEMMRFFREQVAAKLQAGDSAEEARVVIVLSAPVFFRDQEKIAAARLPRDPNRRLYYLRDRPPPPARAGFNALESAQPPVTFLAADDIEHVIRGLDGRLLSVMGPEEFRKALSTILSEVSRY